MYMLISKEAKDEVMVISTIRVLSLRSKFLPIDWEVLILRSNNDVILNDNELTCSDVW